MINNILEFVSDITLYLKLVIIIALITHCLFKRYDKLSIKYRSKAFAILIFAYITVDFTEGIVRKFYILPLMREAHFEIDRKSEENYIELDTKIKKVSDKIYDDFGLNKQKVDTLKK